jgi:hypothetical protein
MSYHLGCTEDNVDMKKAVNEAQGSHDAQDKREWVEWAGKTLMPWLYTQIARAEQDAMDDLQRQQERVQQEEEWAAKEAELEEKEAEYIRQMNAKEIDEDRFWELVAELDLERPMGESVAEGPATTQDKEVGESKQDESTEEEPAVAEKAVESSTVGQGKRKAAPASVRGHRSISLLPLLSPTSPCPYVFPILTSVPSPRIIPIADDPQARRSDDIPEVNSPIIVDFPTPTPLVP